MICNDDQQSLVCTPIGVIRTQMKVKFDAPPQPIVTGSSCSVVELHGGNNFEMALRDLEGFDRIWLLCWFNRNKSWRPLVLPPRGRAHRRGVFSTRSPHRPNPIALTAVPLLGIEGRRLYVGDNDLLDGTPVLDIKPYLPSVDSFPEAKIGWLADVEREIAEGLLFSVVCSDRATTQLEWLRVNWQVDFFDRAKSILAQDPTPHRTRRITKNRRGDGFIMGCGPWRLLFDVVALVVNIRAIEVGYPNRLLFAEGCNAIADRDAQIAFLARWPRSE